MTTRPSRRLWRQGSIMALLAGGGGLAVFVLWELGQFSRTTGIATALFVLLVLPVLGTCLFQYGRRMERERLLSQLAENSPGFTYTVRLLPDGHAHTSFASAGTPDILIHPDDDARFEAAATESAHALTPLHGEFRILHPKTGELWVEVRSLPQVEPDGRMGWHGIALDITERKRLEQVWRCRDHEFRALVENLPDPIFRYDRDCRRTYASPAVERITGKKPGQLVGWTPDEMPLADVPQNEQLVRDIRQVLETGQPIVGEVEYLAPDGQLLHFQNHFGPECAADGTVVGVLSIMRDVTDYRRLEDALINRERNFRTLVENSPDPIFRYDRDCRRLYVNPAVSRLLGKPPEELIGHIPADGAILVPAQNRNMLQAIRQVFDSRETQHIGVNYVDQNGVPRDFDMLLVPERDTHGHVATVLSLARDITPIRDAERLQSRFLSNLPGFVYSFRMSPEAHFSFPFASPGIEDFYGLRPEDVLHDMAPLHALAHPEDRPRIESAIAESARTMMSFRVEFRVLRPNWPERWLEVISTPERESDGGILWHGMMLDVTKRKHLEAELARRETEFRTLVENSPDVIIRYDRECRRIYCNPAQASVTGIPSVKLLGKTFSEIAPFPLDASSAYSSLIRQVIDNAQAGEMELNWQLSGATTAIHVRVNPEFDSTGQVTGALAVGRDVSAIKQAEERLRKSHDILRALAAHRETEHEKERRDIAHQIHEDLAQNLSALRLNISLFEMSAESAAGAPLLKIMHDIADHTIVRIRDMVSMLRPTVLDLGLAPALHWLADDFKGVGLQFDLALQENVFFNDEVSTFLFRAAQEALVNVALHATATHVHLSLNAVAGVCCLVVRDNGHGFDPDAACSENAFGLIGLREQALHLGGDLSIASTLDQGTTLEIRVPSFTGETSL